MPDRSADSSGADERARPRSLGHDRNFRLYIATRMSYMVALQVLVVAVGWQVYQLTRDPVDLGLVGLSQFAPVFALFLLAGIAADRFDRRTIIAACSAVHALATGLLLVYALSDRLAVWPFFALLFVHGIARAFYQPPLAAILPSLVPAEQFPTAIAWASSVSKAAQLIGPMVGGFLLAWIDDWVYLAALVMFAVAGAATGFMARPTAPRRTATLDLETLFGGFVYVRRTKLVLGCMAADLVAVLLAGVMGILPVFASDILGVGPDGLGVMRAMPAAGGVAMGVVLARIAAPRHMGTTLFVALAVFAGATICFSLSEAYWLSLSALAVYGAADIVSVYVRQTLIQITTPDEMRGRVSAVHSVATNASNELGDFRAGVMAGWIGTVPAVLAGGIATLVFAVLGSRLFPEIRRVDRLSDLR